MVLGAEPASVQRRHAQGREKALADDADGGLARVLAVVGVELDGPALGRARLVRRRAPVEGRALVARARKIQKFLSQPFFVAEQFTGAPGQYVPLADTIRSFREILDGKHDDKPEGDFYMKGAM